MKLREIIAAYKCLGEAKVTKIEESEVLKIVKNRKAMRAVAEEYDAFLKDCQEKFKPENFDELQSKAQRWNELTDEEKMSVNNDLRAYEKKINDAIKEELERKVEVTLEKLSANTVTKILIENGWELRKLDELNASIAE